MRFDWRAFCQENRIPFVTEGPNTARGHISIQCPMCGPADPSQHMGLSLDSSRPYWGCFRNGKHRGRDPTWLVVKLLNCSGEVARSIVNAQAPRVDEFDEVLRRLKDGAEEKDQPLARPAGVGNIPKEFRSLAHYGRSPYADRFRDYLRERGYEEPDEVAQRYGLAFALTGDFSWRLLFPIYRADSELIGWTGRDIRPNAKLRYKANIELPEDALLTFPGLDAAKVVVVCEGPFDAMWIDWRGRDFGVSAVGLLTAAYGEGKLRALRALGARELVVMLDSDALSQAFELAEELGGRFVSLPRGVKDPAELRGEDLQIAFRSISAKA